MKLLKEPQVRKQKGIYKIELAIESFRHRNALSSLILLND